MSSKSPSIVLHTHDKNVIGIHIDTNVEWWSISHDHNLVTNWPTGKYSRYLKPCPVEFILPRKFEKRCKEVGALFDYINKETDSPLVRKIKELDYKWELKMKEKGTFFLTSRVLNADQETTSRSTQTDTAIASGVTSTNHLRGTSQHYHIRLDNNQF